MTATSLGPNESFTALRVLASDEGVRREVMALQLADLPDHAVTVRVEYSSLNYKDALSASGNRGVTRAYPHTPGIDAAGVVAASRDARFRVGDRVLCTGFDLGMNTPGGFGSLIRVPGEWLVPLPEGTDARWAMVIGTAGLTAALGLARLRAVGATPDLGPFVVTGASGAVGSLAVALLAQAGYQVVASSGKPEAEDLLLRLGAASVMPRATLAEESVAGPPRPLLRAEYGGGIDTVGGTTLAKLLRSTVVGGAVAACGMVGGAELDLTVYPFILRGVALLGLDSEHLGMEARRELWAALADGWLPRDIAGTSGLVTEIGLDELDAHIEAMLAGKTSGRVIVRHQP